MSGAEASVTCVLSARVISPVSREIQANHVWFTCRVRSCARSPPKENMTLTHTDTLRFMYMGYIGAHVHETYVYIWNMYTSSNTSFRYLIVDIRHETWRCGTLHIDLSTWIV